MDTQSLLMFTVAALAFGFKPGPGMFVHVTRTLSDGRKAALAMAIGTETGHALTFIFLWSGLTSVSTFNQHIIPILAFCGGVTLIWVGIRSMMQSKDQEKIISEPSSLPLKHHYVSGFGWAFINPINIAFYVGILPTFFNVETLTLREMILAMAILVGSIFLSHLVFIWFAGAIRDRTAKSGNGRLLNILSNSVFMAIGGYIAFSGAYAYL